MGKKGLVLLTMGVLLPVIPLSASCISQEAEYAWLANWLEVKVISYHSREWIFFKTSIAAGAAFCIAGSYYSSHKWILRILVLILSFVFAVTALFVVMVLDLFWHGFQGVM